MSKILFAPGQLVSLTSKPEAKGAILSFVKTGDQTRYEVFMDGKVQAFYESQLQAIISESAFKHLSANEFSNLLTAIQIKSPGLSTLYSLNAARIDFIPYQFRPVLKFIRSDRPRLLIADGVGVGKTIEAGLILREIQARRNIKTVLIICPRPLVTERKWENEMKRFDEKFIPLDSKQLRHCIKEMDLEGEWPDQYAKAIIPYSLFDETLLGGTEKGEKKKTKVGLLNLNPPPRFDLVIVDEAHHARNPETIRHKVVSYFCDHAEAVVFLTATPVQLGNQDLFVLLQMLRRDLVIDEQSFKHLTEPNPFINKAIKATRAMQPGWIAETLDGLQQAANTAHGNAILRRNPDFPKTVELLTNGQPTESERIELIGKLESFHTLSSIINRTRRRDIGSFTVRKPESVYIPFTTQQKNLHDSVLAIQEEILSTVHCTYNVKFMLGTIRRQTASCIFGLKPFLKAMLTKHLTELEILDDEDMFSDNIVSPEMTNIAERINAVLKQAGNLEEADPKFEALLKIVQEKQLLPNNRVMLFSSFRHTLAYLYDKLQKAGVRVGLIHGGVDDDERRELRRRFELTPDDTNSIDVLLFSEVGCEGLDYQFCDCMVNYDLPWNPMRIEQRIGRIDRNGQKSESVLIYNLITPDTIDAEIYGRCLLRIGVFTESIGDCEEILGEVTREIQNIADNYQLNEEEQSEKLQQVADNEIRLYQEQQVLETKQFEFFGISLPETLMRKEIDDASNPWLSQQAIQSLVANYLQTIQGKEIETILGTKELKTLRLSQEVRSKLLADFQKLPPQKNTAYKEWEKWLKGDDTHLQITFEATAAKDTPKITFITSMHPLVLQAADAQKVEGKQFVSLQAFSPTIPAGTYEIAIYQWHYAGIKENMELKVIATSPAIAAMILPLLQTGKDWSASPTFANEFQIDAIEQAHYKLWAAAKQTHVQNTQQIINLKRESLQSSHKARLALLHEQLAIATEDKIIRMRKGQIATADNDFAFRLNQLNEMATKADIIANVVVFGVINVEN